MHKHMNTLRASGNGLYVGPARIADIHLETERERQQMSDAIAHCCNCHDELLEALSELVKCHGDCKGFVQPDNDVMNAARAAIAKATPDDAPVDEGTAAYNALSEKDRRLVRTIAEMLPDDAMEEIELALSRASKATQDGEETKHRESDACVDCSGSGYVWSLDRRIDIVCPTCRGCPDNLIPHKATQEGGEG